MPAAAVERPKAYNENLICCGASLILSVVLFPEVLLVAQTLQPDSKKKFSKGEDLMEHKLPNLPYEKNALEPHISAETLEFHHGKHHATYVTNLNKLIPSTKFENMSLEELSYDPLEVFSTTQHRFGITPSIGIV